MDSPIFKTKPAGYIGQNPAGREVWLEMQARAKARAERIEAGLSRDKRDNRQMMLPGVK